MFVRFVSFINCLLWDGFVLFVKEKEVVKIEKIIIRCVLKKRLKFLEIFVDFYKVIYYYIGFLK